MKYKAFWDIKGLVSILDLKCFRIIFQEVGAAQAVNPSQVVLIA